MQYTIEQLKTQLSIVEERIAADKQQWKVVMGPDFQPALEYGEEIRINHLKTINMRLSAANRRALELKFAIADMETDDEN